jgi:L-iditol 2-dehydrogenase
MNRAEASTLQQENRTAAVPREMKAAVYRGPNCLKVESLPVPEISDGEILVRVHACGLCGTDIKKIEHGLVPPPRIFGHETAGVVVRAGAAVTKFAPGDRVAVYHHIPCRSCFFCERKLYSQCEFYRRTGTSAGFEPAGGGFAEYVRVMDWIVQHGTVPIPADISFEEASFLEPLNTCLKALETAGLQSGEILAILGQGPVGLLMMQAAVCEGAQVIGLDFMPTRLAIARELGAAQVLKSGTDDVPSIMGKLTEGRGADVAIVATADPKAVGTAQTLVRRGGRVLLFAQTVPGEMIPVDASRICVEEKRLIGSYSASVDLQEKAAHLIFSRKVKVRRLITHQFGLDFLTQGIQLASHPTEDSLKVMIKP